MEKMDILFDISREENKQRCYLEERYRLCMRNKDYDFYNDQKTTRIAKRTAAVEKLTTRNSSKEQCHQKSPTTSKRLPLESTVANIDALQLFVSVLLHFVHRKIDCLAVAKDLQQNRSTWLSLGFICDRFQLRFQPQRPMRSPKASILTIF